MRCMHGLLILNEENRLLLSVQASFLFQLVILFFDDLLLPFITNILIFSFLLSSICMLN
jgi:hypothetical protein